MRGLIVLCDSEIFVFARALIIFLPLRVSVLLSDIEDTVALFVVTLFSWVLTKSSLFMRCAS